MSYPAPVAASGWSYRLVANGFTKPRGIAFDSAGALLVVDSGVGLARLTFHDEGGTCLSVANKTMLLESDEVGHLSLCPVLYCTYWRACLVAGSAGQTEQSRAGGVPPDP